jgi:hypothetical protein
VRGTGLASGYEAQFECALPGGRVVVLQLWLGKLVPLELDERDIVAASSAEPNQVRASDDVSASARVPLGFDPHIFQRTDATSLPSGSTWPCSPDRARIWPSAYSRRHVSGIRQEGSWAFPAKSLHSVAPPRAREGPEPTGALREMRLDGLRSAARSMLGTLLVVVGFFPDEASRCK